MVKMSIFLKAKKITGITLAALATSIGLFGCSQVVQTQLLNEDQYSVEKGTVVISLEKVPELSTANGWVNIVSDDLSSSLIIARVDDGDSYVVASNHCTHKGKSLNYDPEDNLFRCSGGKGRFNIDGSVAGGPPEKPLRIYSYTIENERLIINLSDV
jgi:Rieske Fe-S protein